MKRIAIFFSLVMTIVTLSSCGDKIPTVANLKFTHNNEFGGLNVITNYNSFESIGINCGDAISVEFSSGTKLENLPISKSYCAKYGNPVFCFYPTYEYPHLTLNFGEDLFNLYNLDESMTLTIRLSEKNRYKDISDATSLTYSNNRDDFNSDEIFANFRAMNYKGLKSNLFYRGASPIFNKNNRAETVNQLLVKNNIDYIIDVSHTPESLNSFIGENKTIDTWQNMYDDGKVFCANFVVNYGSKSNLSTVKKACEFILENEGSFYIHCNEGKDRTGFYAVFFESLAGVSIEDIEKDYMLSYENYFNITKESNPVSYNALIEYNFYGITNFISGKNADGSVTASQLQNGAIEYLVKCGLTDNQIDLLIDKISE